MMDRSQKTVIDMYNRMQSVRVKSYVHSKGKNKQRPLQRFGDQTSRGTEAWVESGNAGKVGDRADQSGWVTHQIRKLI